MRYSLTPPQDEHARWWMRLDPGKPPFRASLCAIGVAFPGMHGKRLHPGYAVLVAGRTATGLPHPVDCYRVIDWLSSPKTGALGEWTRETLRRLHEGDTQFAHPAVCVPQEPEDVWLTFADECGPYDPRFFLSEFAAEKHCLPKLRDRFRLPPLEEGDYEFEDQFTTALLALAFAVVELDCCVRHHAEQPKRTPVEEPEPDETGY